MGLQDMEARGRIGGEPVPAGGPMNDEDLSPEEMAAIREMMGMPCHCIGFSDFLLG